MSCPWHGVAFMARDLRYQQPGLTFTPWEQRQHAEISARLVCTTRVKALNQLARHHVGIVCLRSAANDAKHALKASVEAKERRHRDACDWLRQYTAGWTVFGAVWRLLQIARQAPLQVATPRRWQSARERTRRS
jgi:hypothetical protein